MADIIDGYCIPGSERETCLSAAELLRSMDEAGVARAVIAPQDREIAVDNASGNARILSMAQAAQGRFIPACTVNPWRGEEGRRLFCDAVHDGARLLVLAPALQGFTLTDEIADPLLEAAAQCNVPVYVHTGTHGPAAPTQLILVAQRHARTRFILGHGGSTDHAWDMGAILRAHALTNIWFELSLVRPWAAVSYADLARRERAIFASSCPRNDMAFELRHFRAALPETQYPAFYGAALSRALEGGAA